ncbi:MAG: MATE family efflux transporter [Candidatus Eisenbacteria bacterium]|uniref:Multidrug-efflux transporter n=1 Tax=Eiseniibacteriota bacterium TaxID=2212470 RepID=A0A937X743_UNCEI|nr:MATE family efflux transporter [Candidatus Eisenbacteria bacterium]
MQKTHASGGMRELLAVALPMVVSNSCETMMMFANRVFLSWVHPEFMSAAMGGGLTAFMFMTFFIGLTGYSTALVAQHLGAGQPRRCPAVVSQALLISLAAYPLLLFCLPLGHRMFDAARLAPEQVGPQREYFNILMYGALLGLLRNSLSGFFSGIGRTRVVMIATGLAMAVSVAVSYTLIFGHFGLPALGIRGAALGTLAGSFTGAAILAGVYFGAANRREFGVEARVRFDAPLMRRLLRFGAPSGLEFFLNIMAFNFLVQTFHSYGVSEAAAMTIAFSWDMVSFVPLLGVNIGVISLVGRYMGARDPDTAHKATLSGFKLALTYSAVTFALFSLLPHPLVDLFRTRQDAAAFAEVRPLAVFMVRLVALYVMADAVGIVFGGALRGAGDTFRTMLLSVSGHWVLALAGFLMVRVLHAPPRLTWAVVVALVICLGGVLYLRYRSGHWRRIRVVESAPEAVAPGVVFSDPA